MSWIFFPVTFILWNVVSIWYINQWLYSEWTCSFQKPNPRCMKRYLQFLTGFVKTYSCIVSKIKWIQWQWWWISSSPRQWKQGCWTRWHTWAQTKLSGFNSVDDRDQIHKWRVAFSAVNRLETTGVSEKGHYLSP